MSDFYACPEGHVSRRFALADRHGGGWELATWWRAEDADSPTWVNWRYRQFLIDLYNGSRVYPDEAEWTEGFTKHDGCTEVDGLDDHYCGLDDFSEACHIFGLVQIACAELMASSLGNDNELAVLRSRLGMPWVVEVTK